MAGTTFLYKGDKGDSFTAKTQCDVLEGYLVKAMSTQVVPTTTDPFAVLEVDKCDAAADTNLCVGFALGSITSGNTVGVQTRGTCIWTAAGALEAGDPVHTSADPLAVIDTTDTGSTIFTYRPVGVALGAAGSGEAVLVNFRI